MKWDILRLGRVTSTQKVARDLARRGRNPGLVIVAEAQTEGRGRRGSKWNSPEGGLYMTMVIEPKTRAQLLPILAGVAVAKTIKVVAGVEAELKWPNDILVSGRKVGGVIAESGWAGDKANIILLGIGVNINNPVPKELPQATTLSLESGSEIDVGLFLNTLIQELDYHLELMDSHPEVILRSWTNMNRTLGKIVTVTTVSGETIQGYAADIDEYGALILETENGKRRIVSGNLV